MKFYITTSTFEADEEGSDQKYTELSSSASAASKTRTRLKKLGHTDIGTEEIDVDPTRSGIIKFVNERWAHETWAVES